MAENSVHQAGKRPAMESRVKETRLKLREIALRPKHNMEPILPGVMPGSVAALIAPGATGKSFWLGQLTLTIGGPGLPEFNFVGMPHKRGKVVYLSAEDIIEEVEDRAHDMLQPICKHKDADTILDAMDRDIEYVSLAGSALNILEENFYQYILQKCHGVTLIILDTLKKFHRENENDNTSMGLVINQMSRLCHEAQKGPDGKSPAAIYAHHQNRASLSEGHQRSQHDARGASVLIEDARLTIQMVRMTASESTNYLAPTEDGSYVPIARSEAKNFVVVAFPKVNFKKEPGEYWYRKDENGVLIPTQLQMINPEPEQDRRRQPRQEKNPKAASQSEKPVDEKSNVLSMKREINYEEF